LRVLVTLAVPALVWALARVQLPGLHIDQLPPAQLASFHDWSGLSIVALGLMPAVSGFLMVEVLAALVPRWRPPRTDGVAGRRSLRRAALVLTALLAAYQAFFLTRFIDSMPLIDPGIGTRLVIVATLVGGTFLVLALSWVIDRFGLGNGFSVLLV